MKRKETLTLKVDISNLEINNDNFRFYAQSKDILDIV